MFSSFTVVEDHVEAGGTIRPVVGLDVLTRGYPPVMVFFLEGAGRPEGQFVTLKAEYTNTHLLLGGSGEFPLHKHEDGSVHVTVLGYPFQLLASTFRSDTMKLAFALGLDTDHYGELIKSLMGNDLNYIEEQLKDYPNGQELIEKARTILAV